MTIGEFKEWLEICGVGDEAPLVLFDNVRYQADVTEGSMLYVATDPEGGGTVVLNVDEAEWEGV
jgi:hypothetical protein